MKSTTFYIKYDPITQEIELTQQIFCILSHIKYNKIKYIFFDILDISDQKSDIFYYVCTQGENNLCIHI